jgi:uncharacterized protein YndB with AHSA1/START domain
MEDYGSVTEAGTLRIERLLPGPIERIWAWLTEPEKRAKWLAGGPMDLFVGGRAELRFHHADLSAEKTPPEKFRKMEGGHTLKCRITACDPPRLLAYTWGEDWGEVTFELTPRGKQALLVVTHRRLDPKGMASVAAGWHTHLSILSARLEEREPSGFWSTYTRLETAYAQRLATPVIPEAEPHARLSGTS